MHLDHKSRQLCQGPQSIDFLDNKLHASDHSSVWLFHSKDKIFVVFWATPCFIDIKFARTHNIPRNKITFPILVEVIDGRTLCSGAITGTRIPLSLQIGDHQEEIIFNLITLDILSSWGYHGSRLTIQSWIGDLILST